MFIQPTSLIYINSAFGRPSTIAGRRVRGHCGPGSAASLQRTENGSSKNNHTLAVADRNARPGTNDRACSRVAHRPVRWPAVWRFTSGFFGDRAVRDEGRQADLGCRSACTRGKDRAGRRKKEARSHEDRQHGDIRRLLCDERPGGLPHHGRDPFGWSSETRPGRVRIQAQSMNAIWAGLHRAGHFEYEDR